jgi:hypothetical protein
MLSEGLEVLSGYFTADKGSGELLVKDEYAIILCGERVIVSARELNECAWKPKKVSLFGRDHGSILDDIEVFKKIEIGSL